MGSVNAIEVKNGNVAVEGIEVAVVVVVYAVVGVAVAVAVAAGDVVVDIEAVGYVAVEIRIHCYIDHSRWPLDHRAS